MWIYLQYFKFLNAEDACKNPLPKDGFRIFHPSSFETAHPKDGWTGLSLRPYSGCTCQSDFRSTTSSKQTFYVEDNSTVV